MRSSEKKRKSLEHCLNIGMFLNKLQRIQFRLNRKR